VVPVMRKRSSQGSTSIELNVKKIQTQGTVVAAKASLKTQVIIYEVLKYFKSDAHKTKLTLF
jgi:hypothetical protein